jgi:hypothetical protein
MDVVKIKVAETWVAAGLMPLGQEPNCLPSPHLITRSGSKRRRCEILLVIRMEGIILALQIIPARTLW